MKEKQVTKIVYETVDGQQFDTKEEAKEHETKLFKDTFSLKELATMLKEYCIGRATCSCCPFYDEKDVCGLITSTPDDWIL
jgi:hypothetical protein